MSDSCKYDKTGNSEAVEYCHFCKAPLCSACGYELYLDGMIGVAGDSGKVEMFGSNVVLCNECYQLVIHEDENE